MPISMTQLVNTPAEKLKGAARSEIAVKVVMFLTEHKDSAYTAIELSRAMLGDAVNAKGKPKNIAHDTLERLVERNQISKKGEYYYVA